MTNIFKIKKSNPHLKQYQGWQAFNPKGHAVGYIVKTRAFAQGQAARNFVQTNGWTMPTDWHRARDAGWTVCRVMVVPL